MSRIAGFLAFVAVVVMAVASTIEVAAAKAERRALRGRE